MLSLSDRCRPLYSKATKIINSSRTPLSATATHMARIAILGATGYTALELLKILARHPQAEVVAATTRQENKPLLSEVHPSRTGLFNLRCENLSAEQAGKLCDIAFCCLPHTASMEAIPQLLEAGCRVVDLSADYRLRDPGVYETWYQHVHSGSGSAASGKSD